MGSGPSIGPPDGIHYEVVSVREETRMSAVCGFNDLGVPNGAVFSIEERRYSEYLSGQLLRTWTESAETFIRCAEA